MATRARTSGSWPLPNWITAARPANRPGGKASGQLDEDDTGGTVVTVALALVGVATGVVGTGGVGGGAVVGVATGVVDGGDDDGMGCTVGVTGGADLVVGRGAADGVTRGRTLTGVTLTRGGGLLVTPPVNDDGDTDGDPSRNDGVDS